MRAITVKQPWAWAIAAGYKTVENRSHGTAYRGPLIIHTSRTWSQRGEDDERIAAVWGKTLGLDVACHPMRYPDLFPEGQIVAVVDLVDVHVGVGGCCRPWGEMLYDRNADRGRYAGTVALRHWVIENPRPTPQIHVGGRLGIWTPPPPILARLEADLANPSLPVEPPAVAKLREIAARSRRSDWTPPAGSSTSAGRVEP